MVQRTEDARFALETLKAFRVGCKRTGEYLDGDRAVKARIARALHFAHAAGTDKRQDFVDAESCA